MGDLKALTFIISFLVILTFFYSYFYSTGNYDTNKYKVESSSGFWSSTYDTLKIISNVFNGFDSMSNIINSTLIIILISTLSIIIIRMLRGIGN